MAIVKMNEFTLLAFEAQRSSLLEKLQAFENAEISQFSDEEQFTYLKKVNESKEIVDVEGDLSKIKFAIELLEKFKVKGGMFKSLKEGKKTKNFKELEDLYFKSDWKNIYQQLKEKEHEISQISNKTTKLLSTIDELKPWINLDISLSKINSLKNTVTFVGIIPLMLMDTLNNTLESSFNGFHLEIMHESTKEVRILLIIHKEDEEQAELLLKKVLFSKVNIISEDTPRNIIENYTTEIHELKIKIETINNEIKLFAVKLDELMLIHEYLHNKILKLTTAQSFLKSDNIVAVQGYYPATMHEEFIKTIESAIGNEYYLEYLEAEGDTVPVLLENNTVFSSFEPITAMYSTPRYNEIDPTPLFTPFYIIFFGMMLSDAAYGLIMFLCTAYALKKFNLDDEMKKSVRMFFYLSISTIVWGVLYGSYFGYQPIPALWMTPDSDVSLLMIVSILMGLIQIYVGLGIKAYMLIKNGDTLAALFDVGLWYITLTGTIIWAVDALGSGNAVGLSPTVVKVAGIATIVGMVFIVLTHGRSEKSVGAKLGTGLYSLYGITSYVGDLVSYTRLAALGLATGFIGAAFNIMVGMLGKSIFTIIFAAIVFTFGHIFNLLINALGAYVHTSRLQYLEYFGKFYEGGGKTFNPLKYSSKYFKIKNYKN